MAGSTWSERRNALRAVWLVRSRQLAPRLSFWLILAGYDVRDRSRLDIFYIPYLLLFWSGWFFAMLSALAGGAVPLLLALNAAAPARAAVLLGTIALGGWWLFSLWQSSRRSPLTFTAADAQLLCQTPVNRRTVGFLWLLGEWPLQLLPFALGLITLGFAVFETQTEIGGTPAPDVLARYLWAGVHALLPLLPLHFGLLSLSWAAGALRLHGGGEWRARRWAFPLLLLGGILLSRFYPISIPLAAGLVPPDSAGGLLLAAAWMGAGVAAFWGAAAEMNLSRAAHETSGGATRRVLKRAGARNTVRRLEWEERLGSGRTSSAIPAGRGTWALFWKDNVRAWRQGLRQLFPWLGIATLSLGVAAAPEWPIQAVGLVFWALWVGNRSTGRLHSNLEQWWLWRQLPLAGTQLIWAALIPPILLLVGLGLGAAISVHMAGLAPAFPVGWLLPVLAPIVSLAAAYDVLRQAQPSRLLSGEPPAVSGIGWLMGVGLVLLTLLPGWWTIRLGFPGISRLLLSLLAGIAVVVIMGEGVRRRARQTV